MRRDELCAVGGPFSRSDRRYLSRRSLSRWYSFEELNDQPPFRGEVLLGSDEPSKIGKSHRLATHIHSVTNAEHPVSRRLRAAGSATGRSRHKERFRTGKQPHYHHDCHSLLITYAAAMGAP